jgi:hypothetical protein
MHGTVEVVHRKFPIGLEICALQRLLGGVVPPPPSGDLQHIVVRAHIVGVPDRRIRVAERGYTPYVQFPWSQSIAEDWSVNGMVTVTWSTVAKTIFEPTL